MKKFALAGALVLIVACVLNAQPHIEEMPLYPGAVPNSKDIPDPERVETRANGGRFISNTAVPTLTAYRPESPNGKAVIICPGGGYRGVAIDKEGHLVAESLTGDSVTAFVLKYRTPSDNTCVDKSLAPLQDAQQLIRYVRGHAAQYGLDPTRIGIMGFSAGGHLAASAATHFQRMADPEVQDTTSVRPDFVVLLYPVISFSDALMHAGSRTNLLGEHPDEAAILYWSADKQVTPASPPAFLVHAGDDRTVPVGNSLAYYSACVENGVPAEMHLYPKGGHGFGLFNTTTRDIWIERLKNWLKNI